MTETRVIIGRVEVHSPINVQNMHYTGHAKIGGGWKSRVYVYMYPELQRNVLAGVHVQYGTSSDCFLNSIGTCAS